MADRNFYMDSQAVNRIAEQLRRENKTQLKYFEREAAAGRLPAYEPPAPPAAQAQTPLPAFATYSPAADPELAMATSISKSMWTSNPGYVLRDGPNMRGSTHTAYAYDREAVAFMKAAGAFGKRFHRRRDEFSQYVEAAARAHHQLGSRPPALAAGTPAAKK